MDFSALEKHRVTVLHRAFSRFDQTMPGFLKFCKKQGWWLSDYALYMALKGQNGGKGWMEWDLSLIHI